MSTLSWRALLSEAWRDCLSGTARVGFLTVLATVLVGGAICAGQVLWSGVIVLCPSGWVMR